MDMSVLQAIFLGIVQGITEFLPVSSSGHLVIIKQLFGMETEGGLLFDVMLHVGTLAAVFVVYWKDIRRMILETLLICRDIVENIRIFLQNKKHHDALRYRKIIHNNYRKFVVLVLVSTIPTGIIGYAGQSLVTAAGKTLLVPSVCLLLSGILLIVAQVSEDGHKIPRDVSYGNAFLIGIAQGLATLPGLSRSGTTITACLLSGFERRFAVKYSFIMSIPAIVGAAILELKDLGGEQVSAGLVGNCVAGGIVAAVTGFICMKTMLAAVRHKSFKGFATYCIAVGIVAIVMNFLI